MHWQFSVSCSVCSLFSWCNVESRVMRYGLYLLDRHIHRGCVKLELAITGNSLNPVKCKYHNRHVQCCRNQVGEKSPRMDSLGHVGPNLMSVD